MILDVKRLNGLKEYSGEREFSFNPSETLIDIPYVSFFGEAKAKISYDIFDDDLVEIRGCVEYRLKGLCSRCLNDAEESVCGEIFARYTKEGDGEDYAYDGRTIDLSELFNDAVVFSVPRVLSCKDGCVGIAEKEAQQD